MGQSHSSGRYQAAVTRLLALQFYAEANDMPVIAGFDKLASVPEEQITDKSGAASYPANKAQWFTGE